MPPTQATANLNPNGAARCPTGRCSPYSDMPISTSDSVSVTLSLLVLSPEHIGTTFPRERVVSAPPLSSPLHNWMVSGTPDGFIGPLDTSWVFYRDMAMRDEIGNATYRPSYFARVTSADTEPFIMRMTADWFATAKRYLALPAHGRSVHHVTGDEVQAILNSTDYEPPTPKDWEFEVLTKKVVFHAHHWGSTTTTPDTTVPEPSTHTLTSRLETKGVLTPKTKGVTLPNDHKRSVKRYVARSKTTHKRAKIEAKASMAYSDLVPDNRHHTNESKMDLPTPPPTKPTFNVKPNNQLDPTLTAANRQSRCVITKMHTSTSLSPLRAQASLH